MIHWPRSRGTWDTHPSLLSAARSSEGMASRPVPSAASSKALIPVRSGLPRDEQRRQPEQVQEAQSQGRAQKSGRNQSPFARSHEGRASAGRPTKEAARNQRRWRAARAQRRRGQPERRVEPGARAQLAEANNSGPKIGSPLTNALRKRSTWPSVGVMAAAS